MRARQFVIEYDRAKTAQAFSAKLVNQTLKDPTAPAAVKQTIKDMEPQQAAEMILQKQIEVGDPTKQKKFAQALALKYANGLIKWEDVTSTMRDYLTKFHKLNLKKMIPTPRNDFNRYSDLGDFYSVVDEYPDPDENSKVKDQGKATEIYNDSEIRVIVPKDRAAACYYGQGTRWCTAARTSNQFEWYNDVGDLYIVLPKKPKYTGEKYQLHLQSKGFMNEQDKEIDLNQFVKDYPTIRNVSAISKAAVDNFIPELMSVDDANKMKERMGEIVKNLNFKSLNDKLYTLNLNLASDTKKINKELANALIESGIMDEKYWKPLREFPDPGLYYAIIDKKSTTAVGAVILLFKGWDDDGDVYIVDNPYFHAYNKWLQQVPEVVELKDALKELKQYDKDWELRRKTPRQLAEKVNEIYDKYGRPHA